MFLSGTAWRLGSLFGTPIFVQPGYLFMLVLFWWFWHDEMPGAPVQAAVLIAFAITLSLLVHEFGHVLASRLNGHRAQVVLVMMGGLTMSSGESRGWRGVFLSLAGPGAGLLFWAILAFLVPKPGPDDETLWPVLLGMLLWINLVWSLFNLLPIYPMDGGQALQNFVSTFRRADEAARVSAIVSIVFAVAIGILALQFGYTIALVFMALMALENWERLKAR